MVQPDDDLSNPGLPLEGLLHTIVKTGIALWVATKDRFYLPLALRLRIHVDYRSTTLPRLAGNPVLVRRLAAARILFFPQKLVSIWRLDFFRRYFGAEEDADAFFFLTHNYYLSKYFTLRERVDCAISHYRHETRNCGADYHRSVYRSAGGMMLWRRLVNGTSYSLVLRATEDYRFEGDLSILCLVDGARVCRLSFTYISGALFGLDLDFTMFVTRNQLDRCGDLQRFRQDFKQNSPPYFCLAALSGIALAHGIRCVCAIKDDAQVAYDERYAASFKNSYSVLWEVFGGEEIAGRYAYKMPVPLSLTPIQNVKHRSRAAARRQNWLEISVDARQAIMENRLTDAPR